MREAIAHYKVLESLGSGGLGEVYRARDTNLGRTVAVKVLPPAITSDPEQVQNLLDTVARLVGLSHPNIAMLYEAGQEGGQRYLVFEFVQGEPLGTLIRDRPLNVRRVIDFAINLCDGLAEAHAAGLIH
jgi:serine/threonine protein kinase